MSDARRALEAAREAQAVQRAPAAVERASAALEDASAQLRAGNYDRARALASQARDEAILARMLAAQVGEIESAIEQARAAGRPWQGAAALLRTAQEESRQGNLPRALKTAQRALALAR